MQVPEVLSFSFNATLGTAKGTVSGGLARDPVESVSFPLFMGGERRSMAALVGNGSLPRSMQEAYVPSQVQLLCVAEVGRMPSLSKVHAWLDAEIWQILICRKYCLFKAASQLTIDAVSRMHTD